MKHVFNKAAESNVIHGLQNVASAKTGAGLLFWIASLAWSLCFCAVLLRSVSNQFYGDASIFQASIGGVHFMPPLLLCSNSLGNGKTMAALGYPVELLNAINSIQYLKSTGFLNTGTAPDKEYSLASLLATGVNASNVVVQDILRQMGQYMISKHMIYFDAMKYMVIPIPHHVSVELVSFGYCLKFDPSKTNLTATGAQYTRAYMFAKDDNLTDHGLDGFFLALSTDQPTFTPVDQKIYRNKSANVRIEFSITLRRKNCESSPKSEASECFYKCVESRVKCGECELFNPAKNQTLSTVCLQSAACAKEIQRVSAERICSLQCYRPCRVINYLVSKHVSHVPLVGWELFVYLKEVNRVVSMKEIPAISFIQFVGYTGGNLGVFFGFNLLAITSLMKDLCRKRQRSIPTAGWRLQDVVIWTILFIAIAASSTEVIKTYAEERTSSQITISPPHSYPQMFVCGKWLAEEKLEKAMSWKNEDRYLTRFNDMCRFIRSLANGDPFDRDINISPIPDWHLEQMIETLKSELNEALSRNSLDLESFMLSIAADPSTLIQNVTTMSGKPVAFKTQPVVSPMGVCYRTEFDYEAVPDFDMHLGGLNVTLITKNPQSKTCMDSLRERMIFFAPHNLQGVFFEWTMMAYEYDYAFTIREKNIEKKSTNKIACQPDDTKMKCIMECLDHVVDCDCKIFMPPMDPVPVRNVSQLCHRRMLFWENCFFVKTTLREAEWRHCENQCLNPCTQKVYNFDTQVSFRGFKDNVHTVTLKLDYAHRTLNLQEFLLYDGVQLLCTVESLFGVVFGYSMISLCKALLTASQKMQAFRAKIS